MCKDKICSANKCCVTWVNMNTSKSAILAISSRSKHAETCFVQRSANSTRLYLVQLQSWDEVFFSKIEQKLEACHQTSALFGSYATRSGDPETEICLYHHVFWIGWLNGACASRASHWTVAMSIHGRHKPFDQDLLRQCISTFVLSAW